MRRGTGLLLAGLLVVVTVVGVALTIGDSGAGVERPPSLDGRTGPTKPVGAPAPTGPANQSPTRSPTATPSRSPGEAPSHAPSEAPSQSPSQSPSQAPAHEATHPAKLPFGGTHIFPGRTLVAYYGTAGTGSLGVLGERPIPEMTARLRQAARPFARRDKPAQIVYELIVTVADGHPGPDGDYSHDISRDKVQDFIDAAHRNKALLVLDVQPGRSSFVDVVRRWEWALKDPWVGLALDPEWRMGPHQVPARTIGHVRAGEVNRVGWWLNELTGANHLPDKLLLVHEFRPQMVTDVQAVSDWPRLSEIQHVDGFGNQNQKLGTYGNVERDPQFRMGFKLFYDEDKHLMRPAQVLAMRPTVRFISYQ